MIRNNFPGRCPCGRGVKKGAGFVRNRRIVCADCGGEAAAADDSEREDRRQDYDERPIYGFDDI